MTKKTNIVLIGITLLVLYIIWWYRPKEGFAGTNIMKDVTSDAAVLLPPMNNPLYDPRDDASQAAANAGIQAITSVPVLQGGEVTSVPITSLPTGLSGTVLATIKKCEAITGSDCSAFDNSEFAENCGICFEPGTTSTGEKRIGGLYFSPEHRDLLKNEADAMPSVGSCPKGKFAVSAARCKRVGGEIACQKSQTFGPDCVMCADTQKFSYVDFEDAGIIAPALVLAGKGQVISIGGTRFSGADGALGPTAGKEFPLDKKLDGYSITLDISGSQVGGYIKGDTKRGEYRQDIFRLIDVDLASKAKPRASGKLVVNGEPCVKIVAGAGANQRMQLQLNVTFTFIGTESEDVDSCPTAPFISSAQSASKLSSGTCYKPGNKAGDYSQECLQEIWAEAGCTAKGTDYPAKSIKTAALNAVAGKGGTLADISNYIFELATRATSGTTSDGRNLTIREWGDAAKKCTGEIIEGPCDLKPPAGQKISKDCMTYLYKNLGAKNARIGATYSGNPDGVYCTDDGLINPEKADKLDENVILTDLPARATNIGKFTIKKNWRIRFLVNPKGIVRDKYASLFHFSATGNDCCTLGDRMPAVWFMPNTTRLHIIIGDKTNGNWGFEPAYDLPLNQDTAVEIEANGDVINVKFNNISYGYKQPTSGSRPIGEATLWAPDKAYGNYVYTRMNGSLKNLTFVTSDNPLPGNLGNYKVDPVTMGISEVKAVYNRAFSDMTNGSVDALAACRGISIGNGLVATVPATTTTSLSQPSTKSLGGRPAAVASATPAAAATPIQPDIPRRGKWTNRVDGSEFNL